MPLIFFLVTKTHQGKSPLNPCIFLFRVYYTCSRNEFSILSSSITWKQHLYGADFKNMRGKMDKGHGDLRVIVDIGHGDLRGIMLPVLSLFKVLSIESLLR